MSYQETNRVYERQMSRPKRTVMLAYADKTPERGKTYPSVATVAWMTDYDPRQVQRIKRQLEADGALVEIAPASHHRTPVYELHPEVYPLKSPGRDDKMSPLGDDRDDKMSPLAVAGVTSGTNRGDISRTRGDIEDHRGDIAMSPECKHNVSPNKSANASARDTYPTEVERVNKLIVDLLVTHGIKQAQYAQYDYRDEQWLYDSARLIENHHPSDDELEQAIEHVAGSEKFKHVTRPSTLSSEWKAIQDDLQAVTRSGSAEPTTNAHSPSKDTRGQMSDLRKLSAEKAAKRKATQPTPAEQPSGETQIEKMRRKLDERKAAVA